MRRGRKHQPKSEDLLLISKYNFLCDCCNETFDNKSNLNRHQKAKMNKQNPELENGLQLLKKVRILNPTPEKLS